MKFPVADCESAGDGQGFPYSQTPTKPRDQPMLSLEQQLPTQPLPIYHFAEQDNGTLPSPVLKTTSSYSTCQAASTRMLEEEYHHPAYEYTQVERSGEIEARCNIFEECSLDIELRLSKCSLGMQTDPRPEQPPVVLSHPRTDSNITTVGSSFWTPTNEHNMPDLAESPLADTTSLSNSLGSVKYMSTYDRVLEYINGLPVADGDLYRMERLNRTLEWVDRAFPSQYHLDQHQTSPTRDYWMLQNN